MARAFEWHCVLIDQGVQQWKEAARTSDDFRDSRTSTLIMFNFVLALIKFSRPEKIVDRFIVLPPHHWQSARHEKGGKEGHTISKNWPSIV